jgi:hypothetical protein
MNQGIALEGKEKTVALFFVGIVILSFFICMFVNRLRLHLDKDAANALSRENIIHEVGPWLDRKMQIGESGEHMIKRLDAWINLGETYSCTIGPIDVRGFGGTVIAGLDIIDSRTHQTRYFGLTWNPYSKVWICDFNFSGNYYRSYRRTGYENELRIHPEKFGYGWFEQLFHKAQFEGSTEYHD